MRLLSITLLLVFSFSFTATNAEEAKPENPSKQLPFRISKETTYITEPLTSDGLVDYAGYLNQTMSQGITPENNAAVMYWKAIGNSKEVLDIPEYYTKLVEALGTDPFQSGGPYLMSYRQSYEKTNGERIPIGADKIWDEFNATQESAWKSNEYPNVKTWIDENDKPLDIAIAATKMPSYYRPLIQLEEGELLIAALLPDVQRHREIARCFKARAMLALGEGRPEDAIRDLLALHRLARHSALGSTIIEMLVGIAIESIAVQGDEQLASDTNVTAQQLKNYQQQLSQLSKLNDFERGLLSERLTNLDAVQSLCTQSQKGESDPGDVFEMIGVDTSHLLGKFMAKLFQSGVDWNQVFIGINEFHDQTIASLGQGTYAQQRQGLRNLIDTLNEDREAISSPSAMALSVFSNPEQRGQNMKIILLSLLAPALEQAHEAVMRGEAKTELAKVGIALASHQKKEAQLPKSLEVLVPNYLTELPTDPYTGNSFVYRIDDEGAMIYSLGKNLKDDKGSPIDDDYENHDHVFRVKRIEN